MSPNASHASLAIVALALACGPDDGPDLRERLTGSASDGCNAPEGGGLGHAGGYLRLQVVSTYEDDVVTFEGLATLVCPLVGTYADDLFDFPSHDCDEGEFDEHDIRGSGQWQGEVLELDLESVEFHGTIQDPSGPRFPVPCVHHYELVRADE